MNHPSEDAASVLELFITDVSNLPAEISHIYEELRAKDAVLVSHRETFLSRDAALQKHIRQHGSHDTSNPKEAQHIEQCRRAMKKMSELQEEKLALAQKAMDLIDKHSRRLDAHIANLVRDGQMPADALTPAPPPSNLPAASQHVGGLQRPLQDRRDGFATPTGGVQKKIRLSNMPGPGSFSREGSRAGTPSGHSGTRKTGRKKPPVKSVLDDEEEEDDDDEGGEGEDKRLYCTCQQVSYGSMVGCDDKDCPFEWFHWGCVGLTEEPKGKWYCKTCTLKRLKEKGRSGGSDS